MGATKESPNLNLKTKQQLPKSSSSLKSKYQSPLLLSLYNEYGQYIT